MDDLPRRVGRPYKGDRKFFYVGVLDARTAEEVLQQAAERGLAMGDYLAVVVARAHGLAAEWPSSSPQLLEAPPVRRPRGGLLSTRLPVVVAEAVEREAGARGLPLRRYLGVIVARAHGRDVVLPEPLPVAPGEEALISA